MTDKMPTYVRRGERYAYKELRKDGWPYCPICEEDELYSLSNPATIETIVACYNCHWRNEAND